MMDMMHDCKVIIYLHTYKYWITKPECANSF